MIKAIKHDFISTGRIMGVIYAIMAGITLFVVLTKDVKEGQLSLIGVLLLFVIALCLLVLTSVVVMLDFQKTLYGDQGYLTFTLPIKSWKILASKVIVSGVWFVLALASILGSMWVAFTYVKDFFTQEDYAMFGDLFEMFLGNTKSIVGMVITRVVLFFIEFCFFAIVIFFTNTLSNTRYFQKHSILFTIIFFVPIFFGVYKICELANEYLVFSLFFVDGKMQFVTDNAVFNQLSVQYSPINISEIFVYAIVAVVLFTLTHYLMSKKVNIR